MICRYKIRQSRMENIKKNKTRPFVQQQNMVSNESGFEKFISEINYLPEEVCKKSLRMQSSMHG